MSAAATSSTTKRRRSARQTEEPAVAPAAVATLAVGHASSASTSSNPAAQPRKRSKQANAAASDPSASVDQHAASSTIAADSSVQASTTTSAASSKQPAARDRNSAKSTTANGDQQDATEVIVIDESDHLQTLIIQTMLDKPVRRFTAAEKLVARYRKVLLKRVKETLPQTVQEMAITDLTAYINHLVTLAYETIDIQFVNLLSATAINALLSYAIHPVQYQHHLTERASDKLCRAVIALANEWQQQRTGNKISPCNVTAVASREYHKVALHHRAQFVFDHFILQAFMPECAQFQDNMLAMKIEDIQSGIIVSSHHVNSVTDAPEPKTAADYMQRCIAAKVNVIKCINTRLPLWFNDTVAATILPQLDAAIERAAVSTRLDSSKYNDQAIYKLIAPHIAPMQYVSVPAIKAASDAFHKAIEGYCDRCLVERCPALQLPLNDATFAQLAEEQRAELDAHDNNHAYNHLKVLLTYLTFNDMMQLRQVNREFRGLVHSCDSFDQPLTVTGRSSAGTNVVAAVLNGAAEHNAQQITDDVDARRDQLLELLFTMPPNSLRQCRFLVIDNTITAATTSSKQLIKDKDDFHRALHCLTVAAPLLERLVLIEPANANLFPHHQFEAILKMPKLHSVWSHRVGGSAFTNWTNSYLTMYAHTTYGPYQKQHALAQQATQKFDRLLIVSYGGGERVMQAVSTMRPELLP